jgi:hypothetical protein
MNVMYIKDQMKFKTTNNTPEQVLFFSVVNNSSFKGIASVLARDNLTGDTFSIEYQVCITRQEGAARFVGDVFPSPLQQDSAMQGCGMSINCSGTALIISVLGLNSKEIEWLAMLNGVVYQDNGSED